MWVKVGMYVWKWVLNLVIVMVVIFEDDWVIEVNIRDSKDIVMIIFGL